MIRTLLLAAGFLGVTIALLLLQPGPRTADEPFESAPVTRAESAATDFAPVGQASAPQTRPEPRPLALDVEAAVAPAPVPAPAPAVPVFEPSAGVEDGVQDQVAMMTRNILQELRTPAPAQQAQPAARQVFQAAPQPAPQPVPQPVVRGFPQELAAAAAAGAPDIELVAMVDEALARGEISAQDGHYTASGTLDTPILLLSLLPARAPLGVNAPREDVLYRVQPTDSLAGIAALFYGQPDAYDRILSANADRLRSPRDIFTGQLLRIPAL